MFIWLLVLHATVLPVPVPLPAQDASVRQGPELVLEGVIVTPNPASAVALVRSGAATRARPVRVGESVGGYVLTEVARDSVLVRGSDGVVRIYLQGSTPRTASMDVDEGPEWELREFPWAESKLRLEREIPVILDETRLTPRIESGEVRGLSLERLPDGTLLSESGLLPGDVLLSLNGEPLYSLTELWGLLARLAAANVDELRLVVERRGEERRLAYVLTR